MTEETYYRIVEIDEQFRQNEADPLVQAFQKCSSMYWNLRETLPTEQWQQVNDCFCNFYQVHMALMAAAIEGLSK